MPPLLEIRLAFDPLLRLGDFVVSWRMVGVAGAVLLALAVAAFTRRGLRFDDVLLVAIGAVPGAVIGGRLVHGVAFLDAYQPDPMALLDPARGSLSLLGAVLGGSVTGAYVARMVEGRVAHWAEAAAIPLLVAIGVGKLAQLLGGAGQGEPYAGEWAVAFSGAGPWGSVSPGVPAHPSQVYEGLWTLLGVPLVLAVQRPAGGAYLFLVAVAWWLVGRFLVAFTWRDDAVVGPLNAEQGLALVALAALGVALIVRVGLRRGWRPDRSVVVEGAGEPPSSVATVEDEPAHVEPGEDRGERPGPAAEPQAVGQPGAEPALAAAETRTGRSSTSRPPRESRRGRVKSRQRDRLEQAAGSEPASGGGLLAGEELDPVAASGVKVAEEGVPVPAEGEERDRRGDADVDADHPGR